MTRILLSFLTFLCLQSFAATEKYRLVYRTDPSTSIVVAWCQTSGSNPVVYYDTVDHGTIWQDYTLQNGIDRTESHKGMTHKFSRLTGLQPNTNYYFVIKDDEGVSDRFWFKTLPDNSDTPLSVVAGGDSRTNYSARRNANTLVSKLRPHFVMFGGDMTDLNLDPEWEAWFDDWQYSISSDGRMYPLIPTRGNHEWSNDDIYNMFDIIDPNAIYALTVGGDMARVYTLNSEYAVFGTQTDWLANDLQTNDGTTEWRLAQYHRPMRPHVASEGEGDDRYFGWAQLFYNYHMNVVVECDAHTVKSTWPVQPSVAVGNDEGFIVDSLNGTVYIGEGCWGAPLRTNDDDKSWTRNSAMFNSFNWIHLSKQKIEIRTVGTDDASTTSSVDDNDPFAIPTGLNVWNPSNGDVIVIENPKYQGRPIVEITYPQDQTYFAQSYNITIEADAIDTNGTVQYVEFYANGSLISTDTSLPWEANFTTPANGITQFKAIAYDDEGHYEFDLSTVYSGEVEISSSVSHSNDDAEEFKSDNSMDITSSDLELSVEDNIWPLSDEDLWVGVRFNNLDIPSNAIIDTAYIQFTADGTNADPAITTIYGESIYNASSFADLPNNISARTRTGASVTWNIAEWVNDWDALEAQRTPDLSEIVQEIIDTTNWAPNNAMVFIMEGTGTRNAESFDGEPDKSAELIIKYHMEETQTPPTSIIEKKEVLAFNIYPNPAKNEVTVDLSNMEGNVTFSLYSISGQLVKTLGLKGGNAVEIALEFPAGTYIATVESNSGSYSQKLVIK